MTQDDDTLSAASAGSMANRQTKHDGSPEPTAHLPNTGHAGCRSRESDAGTGDIVEQRWIPVEERLPDRYIRVLAFVKCEPHEHPHAIGFVGCLGLWSLDELHEPSAVVTHWVPLPEPPQGIV